MSKTELARKPKNQVSAQGLLSSVTKRLRHRTEFSDGAEAETVPNRIETASLLRFIDVRRLAIVDAGGVKALEMGL